MFGGGERVTIFELFCGGFENDRGILNQFRSQI